MSKTCRVLAILALIVSIALSVSLMHRGLPQTMAAKPGPLPGDNILFFVNHPQISLQRVAADVPEALGQQTITSVTEDLPLDAAACEALGLYKSPNEHWVAMDVGCAAGSHTLLLEVATGQVRRAEPAPWRESFFLNWVPGGDAFLLRVGSMGDNVILLVNARNGRFEQIDTPSFTYDVTFSPDGRRVLYAVTRGLGFGSEVWVMDRNGDNKKRIINSPAHIIAHPRWSPTGDALAYIRMPDSNVPFTIGELILADENGVGAQVIAPADAGHGYPPVWSPDGQQIAFVVRENPALSAADIAAPYLDSNIYLADVASRSVQALTQFSNALTVEPVWSPDGRWLVFSTDVGGANDIWLVDVISGVVRPVTQDANAHCPVWLAGQR